MKNFALFMFLWCAAFAVYDAYYVVVDGGWLNAFFFTIMLLLGFDWWWRWREEVAKERYSRYDEIKRKYLDKFGDN